MAEDLAVLFLVEQMANDTEFSDPLVFLQAFYRCSEVRYWFLENSIFEANRFN